MQAVGPGAAAERGAQHGRPDVEHGEGAAGQRAVLRQGEPGPRLQILHVPDAHHEAGRTQPDHGESRSEHEHPGHRSICRSVSVLHQDFRVMFKMTMNNRLKVFALQESHKQKRTSNFLKGYQCTMWEL